LLPSQFLLELSAYHKAVLFPFSHF